MLRFEDVRKNKTINTYITKADESLSALGFTEHSFAHVTKVATDAANILETLGFSEREVELAKIAGYMHDIGNLVNRVEHSQTGAVMAFKILTDLGFDADEVATVTTAIGNHDEGDGIAVNAVAAALIIADKTDVRCTRVRNCDLATFDIHDRVNYSVKKSSVRITEDKKLYLMLEIDTKISTVVNYFEIFLDRMILCRKACEKLGLEFKLIINEQQLM